MRTIRRIIKIHNLDGYKVSCLFNNGESRIIDFAALFEKWQVKKGDIEYPLMESEKAFQQIKVVDGSFSWENIKVESTDENGKKVVYHYDLDPIVMYEESQVDESRKIELGLMIRQARKELGLTQEELANKSGTSKHYISRIENNKSGIELSTLVRIIEGGLGKKLQINII
ncbi:MAG: helix-turn-helix domain-containing protein [Bacteroidota bacterium]